jgi:hypothetical protein
MPTRLMMPFAHRGRLAMAAAAASALASLIPLPVCAGEPLQQPAASSTATPLQPPPLALEHAFRLEVQIGLPLELGTVDGMRKRVIPITGGTVRGPRIHGTIVPGGADWQGIREQGSTSVWARYTLRTDEGAYITITNPGVRRGPPEVIQRLLKGERVDPALYYFRSSPSFEVADGPYGWLRESVFVCAGAREPDRVILECDAVL